MATTKISSFADQLEQNSDAVLAGKLPFDNDELQAVIDELNILDKPINSYFDELQETYYEEESDHKLMLLDGKTQIKDIKDRIMVNHVDGHVDEGQIRFTYNHEEVYAGAYLPKKDYELVEYGLKVIGAVAVIEDPDLLGGLSKDAILSLGLAGKKLSVHFDK